MSSTDIALLEVAADAAVQRAMQGVIRPVYRTGTCITPSLSGPTIHEVVIDGDTTSTICHDITGTVDVGVGSRVTVVFAPPHQAMIIGLVSPNGPLRRFLGTTSGTIFSADAVTDMVLTNVPMVGGHTYGVHLHALVEFASVAAGARWLVELRVDGTAVHRFDDLNPGVAGVTHWMVDSTVHYTPDATGEYDLDVYANENVDGANFQLQANSTDVTRTLTVFDYGVIQES